MQMDKKKVLILCYNNLVSDPRVQRQIEALRHDFSIEVCATGASGIADIPFYKIYEMPSFSLTRKIKRLFQFIFRMHDKFYWDDYKKKLVTELSPKKYDVIIANDIYTLPLALGIAGSHSKVYFDAHEYHPKEWEDRWTWRLMHQPYVTYLCKKYISKAHAFSTVSEGIAEEYERTFSIKPFVVTNATKYQELQPVPLNSARIKMVHHTLAIPSRKIELTIDMMQFLPSNYLLDLVIVGKDPAYINLLKKRASKFDNVRILPPVDYEKIPGFLNQYDIGVLLWPKNNFNYLHGLPNKFFEFIQARLALATSPSPDIARITSRYQLGVTARDYSAKAMAEAILSMPPDEIMFHKSQSHLNAKTLSADENIRRIHETANQLISK